MMFHIELCGREQLVPALLAALLETVEIVPRVEMEEKFLLGALDATSEASATPSYTLRIARTTG